MQTNEFFEEQSGQIHIESQEPQLINFLYQIGNDPSMIRVSELSLKPADQNRYRFSGSITLTANYAKKPPAPAAPAKPAKTAKPAAATPGAPGAKPPAGAKPAGPPGPGQRPRPPIRRPSRTRKLRPAQLPSGKTYERETFHAFVSAPGSPASPRRSNRIAAPGQLADGASDDSPANSPTGGTPHHLTPAAPAAAPAAPPAMPALPLPKGAPAAPAPATVPQPGATNAGPARPTAK